MKECDNSTRKIHISSNFLLSISLLIIFDTLLLRPSLHCNTPLHFTTPHLTTLHHTSPNYTSPNYTSPHFTQLHFTTLHTTTLHHTSLRSNFNITFTLLICAYVVIIINRMYSCDVIRAVIFTELLFVQNSNKEAG